MKISRLARRCGLARSTLLYYEKLGVIAGTRGANGYRHYDDDDLQRLRMGTGSAGRRAQPQAVPRLSGGRAGAGNALETRVRGAG